MKLTATLGALAIGFLLAAVASTTSQERKGVISHPPLFKTTLPGTALTKAELEAAIEGHVLAEASLLGTYQKGDP